MVYKDVAEVVVVVHCPDFNGHTTNLANILEWLFIKEIARVGDLLGRPRSLQHKYIYFGSGGTADFWNSKCA